MSFDQLNKFKVISNFFCVGLTPDDVTLPEYKEAFSLFDKNGDGKVTAAELGFVFRSLGKNLTESELIERLNSVDVDHNGTIEFPEFLQLVATKGGSGDNELREAFNVFDKDKDGKINKFELKEMLASLGEDITDAEVEEMIQEADDDKNGTIEIEEFIKIMSNK